MGLDPHIVRNDFYKPKFWVNHVPIQKKIYSSFKVGLNVQGPLKNSELQVYIHIECRSRAFNEFSGIPFEHFVGRMEEHTHCVLRSIFESVGPLFGLYFDVFVIIFASCRLS